MKRIISILLALALCLFACEKQDDEGADGGAANGSDGVVNDGGQTDPEYPIDSDTDVGRFLSAFMNTLSQDNATLIIDLSEDIEAGVSTVEAVADLKSSALIYKYSEFYGGQNSNFTFGYDDGYVYECETKETGLPHGRVTSLQPDDGDSSQSLMGMHLISLLENPTKIDLKNLATVFSGIFLATAPDEDIIDSLVTYALTSLADEEWLRDKAGFSVTREGDSEVFTIKPDLYALGADALSYMGDKLDAELLHELTSSLEDAKDEMAHLENSLTVTVKDGLLDRAELSVTSGVGKISSSGNAHFEYITSKIRFTFSNYGSTVVPIEELKQTMNDAHNGHTECVRCGDNVYFACYCSSCTYELYCQNFCGNLRTDDSQYCSTCYTPCGGCGESHGYKSGYCYDCYYKVYCEDDCGNKATNFPEGSYYGYCDDCYDPCEACNNNQGRSDYNGYCGDCFRERFCMDCYVNSAVHTPEGSYGSYCDDCYAPCPACGKQGSTYYNGYCYECSYKNFCCMCHVNAITHPGEYSDGYCDDCFKACSVCGKYASSAVEGYCYDCALTVYCNRCYENKITHTAENGRGYCDGCYSKCSECGAEICELKNGRCYECYYNTYCHECGENPITHGAEYEHRLCDTCYNK